VDKTAILVCGIAAIFIFILLAMAFINRGGETRIAETSKSEIVYRDIDSDPYKRASYADLIYRYGSVDAYRESAIRIERDQAEYLFIPKKKIVKIATASPASPSSFPDEIFRCLYCKQVGEKGACRFCGGTMEVDNV